jgi:hypothetical protein
MTSSLRHVGALIPSLCHFVTLSLLLCFLPACASDPTQGYSFTSSHDASIRTVAVPIFQNPTYSRGLETELTDAIIKEIQAKTPWRVVPEGSGANSTLTGKLTESRLRRLSTGADTGYAQELAVELTVDFDFKDARTGKTILSRKGFTATDEFVPASPANERIEKGEHGAVQKLARDIVAELRSSW